jgi:hypothetical protein
MFATWTHVPLIIQDLRNPHSGLQKPVVAMLGPGSWHARALPSQLTIIIYYTHHQRNRYGRPRCDIQLK